MFTSSLEKESDRMGAKANTAPWGGSKTHCRIPRSWEASEIQPCFPSPPFSHRDGAAAMCPQGGARPDLELCGRAGAELTFCTA